MVLSKFRRIVSGSLAAVMLVSAGAAAFAKDETVPTEISGTYKFREIGTLRDLVDRMAEPVLKSIAQHLNSGNNDPNAMSKVIETMLRNDQAHNEAHNDRMRTDLFYFNEDWFKGDAADVKPNWDMAVMSLQICNAVWHNTESDVDAFLKRLGFRNVSFYNSDNAEPGTIYIEDIKAAKSSTESSTLLDKDVEVGGMLSMNGNISVKKDTSQLKNGLSCSETTMRAEGDFNLLFNRVLKGYIQLSKRDVTGTVANNGSETVWNAYRIERTTYKDDLNPNNDEIARACRCCHSGEHPRL